MFNIPIDIDSENISWRINSKLREVTRRGKLAPGLRQLNK